MELPNPEHFNYRDCFIAGEDCLLITPKVSDGDGIWTPNNLNFRSVILRKTDGLVISRNFPKFFNYLQSAHLYPDPSKFNDWTIENKEDGSTILYSRHNGHEIIRTRGATSVDVHNTGDEVKHLISELNIGGTYQPGTTLLFENCTPNHRIVLKYEKPKLVLLDIIRNKDGLFAPKCIVDSTAQILGCERPHKYNFNTIQEIIDNCKILTDREGYVISFANNQHKIKLKSIFYIQKHRLKSNFDSLPHVLDYWFSCGRPQYKEFFNKIQTEIDYETAADSDKFLIQISELAAKSDDIINKCKSFASSIKKLDRKSAAQQILQGPLREYSDILFSALDDKQITDKMYRKVMERKLCLN